MAAAQKTILKNTRQQYVVHLAGQIGSSTTIALTDLVRDDETTSGALTVNIHGVTFGTYDTGVITVTRGASSVGVFNGCDVVDFQGYGMPIGNTTDIVVTFTASPGWIILDLWKKAGYVEPLTNVGV